MDSFRMSDRFSPPTQIDHTNFGTKDYNLINKLLHWLGSRFVWPLIAGLIPSDLKRLVKH